MWDYVQIHSRAITTEEISAIANPSVAGPILFDDSLMLAFDFHSMGADGVVKDISGYGHDGTITEDFGFDEKIRFDVATAVYESGASDN
jgi:hypothetical protein